MDNENALIAKLKEENEKLRKTLNYDKICPLGKIALVELKGKDIQIEYLTGFPNYDMLVYVFKRVETLLPAQLVQTEGLTKFDVFLITLIKLKLDLPLSYLSIQYRIEFETISKLFRETIIIMKKVLTYFIFWPRISNSLKNTPAQFCNIFGTNRRIFIINCFEVYCERPGNFIPQPDGQRYHSIKFLIAFSPTGRVCYISKSFGGWSSDRFVVENCGFLYLISADDIILVENEIFSEPEATIAKNRNTIVPACISENGQLVPVTIMTMKNNEGYGNLIDSVRQTISKLRQKISILTKKQRIVNSKDTNMFLEYIMLIICAIMNLSQMETIEIS